MKTFEFPQSEVTRLETSVNMNFIKLLGNAWHVGAYFTISFNNIDEKTIINIETNIPKEHKYGISGNFQCIR